jgi:hypothetical protein
MTPQIDPRQLECFLAVAEIKHFRRAADSLHAAGDGTDRDHDPGIAA